MCRLIGLRVRVIGPAAHRTADGRPIVFVSNHSSWLDMLVLGGRLEACFIAKEEVARWPIIGVVARLGRTVFMSAAGAPRSAGSATTCAARLAGGDNLILFPEGTTSDGSRVMPFRSAFLSVAELPVPRTGRRWSSRCRWSTTGWPACRPGGPTGRCSPGTATWISARISGGWRSIAACGRRCCCMRRSIRSAFPGRKELAAAVWEAVGERCRDAAAKPQGDAAHPRGRRAGSGKRPYRLRLTVCPSSPNE